MGVKGFLLQQHRGTLLVMVCLICDHGNAAAEREHQVLVNVTVVTEQPQPGNSSMLADVALLI